MNAVTGLVASVSALPMPSIFIAQPGTVAVHACKFCCLPRCPILQVIAKYHALALRWFLVSTHYRQPVNYTQRALEEASDRLYYVYQTLLDVAQALEAAGKG